MISKMNILLEDYIYLCINYFYTMAKTFFNDFQKLLLFIIHVIHVLRSSQKLSFQTLLVTDGENTFTIFNYINVNLPPINNVKISMGYRYKSFYTSNSYSNQKASFRMSAIPGNTGKERFRKNPLSFTY